MLSSDKNVENIGQLAELLKHYLGLQTEYVKLDVIDKVVRLVTAAALAVIALLIILFILLFLSLAAVNALTPCLGSVGACSVVAGVYVLLLIVVILNRRRWVEKPLVHFLADLLLNDTPNGK